jgi:hypothetical protein
MLKAFLLIFLLNISQISPACVDSENLCKKCNPLTNLCFACLDSDILVPNQEGGCVGSQKCTAGKNYCLECSENEKLCKNCEYGFYPDENGGCSFSNDCKISLKGECLECKQDFVLINKNGMCKSTSSDDFKNCKKITPGLGECEECEDGYYLDGGDKKCTKTKNCYESIFGVCHSCNSGFFLDKRDSECKEKNGIFAFCKQTLDGKTCDLCDDGAHLDSNNNCVNTRFCEKSTDGKCEECYHGYHLSANNNCCVSTENCYYGDKDIGICLDCNMYNYLDAKDYKCSSNVKENEFKYCQKIVDNTCVKCESGYYLGKDSKCTFTPNCEESENGKCLSCSEYYYLGKDNFCSDVEKCTYSRFNFCRECEDGYYYSPKERKCIKNEGNKNLDNCKYNCLEDENLCCECKNNYYFDPVQKVCVDNTQNNNFYKCAFADEEGGHCSQCIEGYYLGSGDKKCTLVDNCKFSENENKCSECDDLFCLDTKNGNCVNNDFLHDTSKKLYFACKKTNFEGTACEQCVDGFKLTDGLCVNLDSCQEQRDGKCLTCKNEPNNAGYYYCANEIFGCIEGHFKNCIRCDNINDLFECTQCEDGYERDQYGACKPLPR